MEKPLAFQSSMGHYAADACVVWCFDDRFSGLLGAFVKDFKNFDLVKVAGGAKALAGDASPDRDFVFGQIETSIRLHGTKKIVLMLHRDCGAYGGSKSFVDAAAEKDNYINQLTNAKSFLKKEIPDMPVSAYFADADGLYEVS